VEVCGAGACVREFAHDPLVARIDRLVVDAIDAASEPLW